MIFITKEIFENQAQLENLIQREKSYIYTLIKSQHQNEVILSELIEKFTNYISFNKVSSKLNILLEYSTNLKYLTLTKQSILLLYNLLRLLDDLKNASENDDIEKINQFNVKFLDINKVISENNLAISQFLHSSLSMLELNSESKSAKVLPITSEAIDENFKEDTKIHENTLIVSEIKSKVLLPFTIEELNKILEKDPNTYSTIQDVIDKKYTLPYTKFKNTAFARFREAFKLIRIKEKGSISSALDLGTELLFNYNLHPAIISACKSLDELDIYLDYLNDNEEYKFNCFDIIFEIHPAII